MQWLVIHKWFRNYVRSCSGEFPGQLFPSYFFLTGGGVVRKLHNIKIIYTTITKLLMGKGGNSENPRIIVLEPTCVGAVNTLKVYLV